MAMSLLNENQRRRVHTHLRLLGEDLDALKRLSVLVSDRPGAASVRDRLAQALAAAQTTREALGLPADEKPDERRHIGAVAEVWAARVEDLRAQRLKAYGAVHPDLAGTLDPLLERLRRALEALADAAAKELEPHA